MWSEDENKIIVHFIRHGKTPLNEKHCYIGSIDEALSIDGRNEITKNSEASIYPDVDKVFVSTKKRAIETANIIYKNHNLVEIKDLSETYFGSFEGKNYEQLKDNLYYRRWIDIVRGESPDVIEKLYGNLEDDENIILPENHIDYTARVINAFKYILLMAACDNSIAVVTHGGTINAILSEYLEEDFYKYMLRCGEGISLEVRYKINKNEAVTVSCTSIIDRIHS